MPDDPQATQPPFNTSRKALAWLWTWGWAHTVISAGLIGAICGFVSGKIL